MDEEINELLQECVNRNDKWSRDLPVFVVSALTDQQTRTLIIRSRPDTRLSQSRAGGQGPYLRSLDHFGRSIQAKDKKEKQKKLNVTGRTDRRIDGWTNGPTKRGVESR